jgi:hypothetical protein
LARLPMLEDILEGRKAPLGAYKFFADYIIECVAGKREWKKQRETITMASATSPTDEAFALLLLENSYDRWRAMAESEDGTSREVTKYTRGKSTGGSRKYEGWTEEGRTRFNELVKFVRKDRLDNIEWDNSYLAERTTCREEIWTAKRAKLVGDRAKLTDCVDDMFDGSDDGGTQSWTYSPVRKESRASRDNIRLHPI